MKGMTVMHHKSHLIFGCLTAGLVLYATLPQGSLRATTIQFPLELIRARNEAVAEILDAAGEEINDATRERLKDVINDFIDFRELSRRALGRYWNERSTQEKQEFVEVFQQLIRNSSVKKLSVYQADSVRYEPPEVDGDRTTVTTVAYKDRRDVEIVYRMHRLAGEWKAYDVVIDGASTVRNYRDSFYKQIAKTSYGEMYTKLVRRLEEQP